METEVKTFYGQKVIVPAPRVGESCMGNSGYTESQIRFVGELDRRRRMIILQRTPCHPYIEPIKVYSEMVYNPDRRIGDIIRGEL